MKRTLVGVAVLVGAVVLLGVAFRAPLEMLATQLVQRFGYLGIAAGVFGADMFTVPLPADVYLLVGIAGGGDPYLVIIAASLASIVGGVGAFAIGLWLGRTRWVRERVDRFRRRHGKLVERSGVVAVIIAALTPVPFSLVCYVAGSLRLRFVNFLFAALFRIPRIAGYYYSTLR